MVHSEAAAIVSQITRVVRSIEKASVAIPKPYKKLLKASVEVSSFAVGFVPGGPLITLVTAFLGANQARTAIQEARDAFKGVPPEVTLEQLKKVHAETDIEIHRAETLKRAEERGQEVLQNILVKANLLRKQENELLILDNAEFAALIKQSRSVLESPHEAFAKTDIDSLISVLHFELKQLAILQRELGSISRQKRVLAEVQAVFGKVLELRRLLHRHHQLSAKSLAGEREVLHDEQMAVYDIEKTSNFFAGQLALIEQHRAALEKLLDQCLRYSHETKHQQRSLWYTLTERRVIQFKAEHQELEDKFQRSLGALHEKYFGRGATALAA